MEPYLLSLAVIVCTFRLALATPVSSAGASATNEISSQNSVATNEERRQFSRDIPQFEASVALTGCCRGTSEDSEALRQARMNYEEKKLLYVLGLSEKPVVEADMVPSLVRRRVTEVHRQQSPNENRVNSNLETDSERSGLKRVYVYGHAPQRGHGVTAHQCLTTDQRVAACMEFKIKRESLELGIGNATLWLHRSDSNEVPRNRTIRVEELVTGADGETRGFATAASVRSEEREFSVRIDSITKQWEERLGQSSDAKEFVKRFRVSFDDATESTPPVEVIGVDGPVLELVLGDAKSRPARHEQDTCHPGHCCLRRFYVNFTELGYNQFIINPPGYWANYCAGMCTIHHMTSSFQAMLRLQIANAGNGVRPSGGDSMGHNNNPSEVRGGCCRPTRFSSLTLTYVNVTGPEVKEELIPNMTVEACGC